MAVILSVLLVGVLGFAIALGIELITENKEEKKD